MKTILNTTRTAFFCVLLAAVLFPNVTSAQQKDYKKELDIVFAAFQKQDYEIIKPLLDDHVLISVKIPVGMNDMILPQVMAQLPVPDSYKIVKTETLGESVRILTEYTYKDREHNRPQNFTFNKEGKIVNLDILSDAKKIEASYNGTN